MWELLKKRYLVLIPIQFEILPDSDAILEIPEIGHLTRAAWTLETKGIGLVTLHQEE